MSPNILPTNCSTRSFDIGLVSASDLYYGEFNMVKLPNAFEPDGDGFADKWGFAMLCPDTPPTPLPQGFSCEEYGHRAYWGRVRFYNRWGQKVFEKEAWGTVDLPFNKNELDWDGNHADGSPAPTDVYVCIFELKNCTYDADNHCPGIAPDCDPVANDPFQDCHCNSADARAICHCNFWAFDVTLLR